ncbi:MAG: GntR family transcriptional regulator [Rhodospirillaceae bacterium]|nr:GntR family transcriptional regulator [Rhodospirillaceae bacterium]|tara:strand:- start:246 stop:953 length:708 start_codon:yes stop_codon:yes gene_type:complete
MAEPQAQTSGVLTPVTLENAPLRRRVAAAIRDAIEVGKLPPGARLVEKDLCTDLNVSRTSLREALRELEAEGLVTHQAHKGLVVSRITRAEAENVYRVRAALEALIVEQFAEDADVEALADLKARAETLRRAYSSNDLRTILDAKKDFYDGLCTGAGNPLVLDLLTRLNSQVTQLRGRSLMTEARRTSSIAEIDALIRALAKRDAAGARKAVLRHVENAAKAAMATLPACDDAAD